jgi:hypothetical protein
MGTPHVHCMSKLPTAHEPADRAAGPVGERQRPGGRADSAVEGEDRVTNLAPEGSYQ